MIYRRHVANGIPRRGRDRDQVVELARSLGALRVKRGWVLADVAERLGVATSTVHQWERGAIVPDVVHFMGWLRVLGLSMEVTDAESEGDA